MRIRKLKSSFNFYESFSDLIFCTLVLFLVIVLFLVLNVNKRVENIQEAERDVEAKQVTLKEEEEQVESRLAKLRESAKEVEQRKEKMQQELSAMKKLEAELAKRSTTSSDIREKILKQEKRNLELKRELAEKQGDLDKIYKVQRFTGHSGKTFLNMTPYKTNAGTALWYPQPVELSRELNLYYAGETTAETAARKQRVTNEYIKYVMTNIKPFTAAMYRDFDLSVSKYMQQSTRAELGVYFTTRSGRTTLMVKSVIKGSPAALAGVKPGDRVVSLDGRTIYSHASLTSVIARHQFGQSKKLVVRRPDGPTSTLTIKYKPIGREASVSLQWRTSISEKLMQALRYPVTQTFRSWVVNNKFSKEFTSARFPSYDASLTRSDRVSPGLPVLYFSADAKSKTLLLNKSRFDAEQFRLLLRSIGGSGMVLEYEARPGSAATMPDWVMQEVLVPTGYVNRSPVIPQ